MFIKAHHGRLVHFAFPDIEMGWEDVPLREIGTFQGWQSYALCGQGWNMQTVEGPPTCSKCMDQIGKLVVDLLKVQSNIETTKWLLRSHLAESEPFNSGVDGE